MDGYQLSPQQQHIWPVIETGGVLYVQGSIKIHGLVNPSLLLACIEKIAGRYDALRITYVQNAVHKFPLQIVQNTLLVSLEQSHFPKNKEEKGAVLHAIDPEKIKTDLSAGPVMHAFLYEIQEAEYLFTLHLSAISCDSPSLQRVCRKILYEYFADVEGDKNQDQIIQYSQFAEWQQSLLKEPEDKGVYFWEKKNFQFFNTTRLSLEKKVETPLPYTPELISVEMPPEKVKLLSTVARQLGKSEEVVLLAGLFGLMGKSVPDHQSIIALVNNKRKYEQLDETIGLLSKTLPLSFPYEKTYTFEKVIRIVEKNIQQAQGWEEYFTEAYLKNALKEKEAAASWGMGFEWIDLSGTMPANEALRTEWYNFQSATDQFKIKLCCIKFPNRVQLQFYFDPHYFDKAYIEYFSKQYQTFITNALGNISLELPFISAVSAFEKSVIMPSVDPYLHQQEPSSFIPLFESQVHQSPSVTAILYEGKTLSYGQLNERVNQLAHYLQKEKGLRPGDFVGIYAGRSDWVVICILAVMKCRAVFVPIDTDYPLQRINLILSDTALNFMFVDAQHLAVIQQSAYNTIQIVFPEVQRLLDNYPKENLNLAYSQDDLAYILFTSGSTGKPKGVVIQMKNLVNYVVWANQYYFPENGEYSFALFTSLAFDLTVTSVFTTLLRGDKLIVYPHKDIDQILEAIFMQDPVHVVKMTPSHVGILPSLLSGNVFPAFSLKIIILGGEAVHPTHLQTLQALGPTLKIYNEYGPTESTVGCTVKQLTGKDISIGKPIAQTKIYILDENYQLSPIGVEGEITIGGEGLALGYLNRPALTEDKFIRIWIEDSWERVYMTGDTGYWLPNGELMYTGRKDLQIKLRGYRIELGEIESQLNLLEGVQSAAVVLNNQSTSSSELVAYVVLEKGKTIGEIKKALQDYLPAYMQPHHIIKLAALPLTVHGKVDWEALKGDYQTQVAYIEPRNETEKKLAQIWQNILEVDRIGVKDDFFKLGGHSIKAIKIISRIHQEMHVRVPLNKMFAHPTIEGLATVISELKPSHFEAIQPLPPQDFYDVSYPQRRLWVAHQLKENALTYNMGGAYEFKGLFDMKAFQKAILSIVQRHEILRTTFQVIENIPKQIVHKPGEAPFKIDYLDLSAEDQGGRRASTIADEVLHTKFDLMNGPLVRIQLLKIAEARHVFAFAMHHIISDAWSMGVLMKELLTLYEVYKNNQESPLKPLRIQYKDFAAWQLAELSEDKLEKHRKYWISVFEKPVTSITLPTDFPRPKVKSLQGKGINYELDQEITAALQQLSQQKGCSLFMTFLTAVYILIYKNTQQNDVVIGTSVAGRGHSDLEDQIGFYVNLLPLRTQFEGNDNCEDLLKKVKENVVNAFEHQIYPFDLLVEDLKLERDRGRSPLFDVSVIFQNNETADTSKELSEIETGHLEGDIERSEFDITFNCFPLAGSLLISTRYSTDLFEEPTILILLEQLKLICQHMIDNPAIKLNNMDIALNVEKALQKNIDTIDFNF